MSPLPRARKRFGQNFLVDRRAVDRITSIVAPGPGKAVLEIGPGRGALTRALIGHGAALAAIEVDRDLVTRLRGLFGEEKLLLLEGDVLDLEPARVLEKLGVPAGVRLVVAGNLPYNISKPLALKLVDWRPWVERAVLMFQREVAQRLTASPGGRDYGPLGILTGFFFRVRRCFDLPPDAFRPAPRVTSTLTEWIPRTDAPAAEIERRLRACLAACFRHRRRTLLANLRVHLGGEETARDALAGSGIDGSRRAETVSPEEFLRLATCWPDPAASLDPQRSPL